MKETAVDNATLCKRIVILKPSHFERRTGERKLTEQPLYMMRKLTMSEADGADEQ